MRCLNAKMNQIRRQSWKRTILSCGQRHVVKSQNRRRCALGPHRDRHEPVERRIGREPAGLVAEDERGPVAHVVRLGGLAAVRDRTEPARAAVTERLQDLQRGYRLHDANRETRAG